MFFGFPIDVQVAFFNAEGSFGHFFFLTFVFEGLVYFFIFIFFKAKLALNCEAAQ